MSETRRRLVRLLRILQRGAPPFDEESDDAMLDAWFGRRSRLPDRTGDSLTGRGQ